MYIPTTYGEAVLFCLITMACWGSWATVARLINDNWRFELFYWDYVTGILFATILLGFTWGTHEGAGRSFVADLAQTTLPNFLTALSAGVLLNIGNILLTTAIEWTGAQRALPLAMGVALISGVTLNYIRAPLGHPALLFFGVIFIGFAVWLDAQAYARSHRFLFRAPFDGIVASAISGILLGLFYHLIAAATARNFMQPTIGKMGPYASVFTFALGAFLSSFLFIPNLMERPIAGAPPVTASDYFNESLRNHLVGILGGSVWGIGLEFSILAAERIGFAISFGLAQGALLVSAIWSIFFWDDYRNAPQGTHTLLLMMVIAYILGLISFVLARVYAFD